MAQIFVSHSAKDKELVELVELAFAATQVRGIFKEFDAFTNGPANAPGIISDIQQSSAFFILLGKHVEERKHTRDWVGWESGAMAMAAFQNNKDVWVLESFAEAPKLSVVIPHLRHYVCLNHADPYWQAYLIKIVASYDDSHLLKAMSAGAAAGAALADENAGTGAILGAGAALLLAGISSTTPRGIIFQCPGCYSVYAVHLSAAWLRCPVCNSRWRTYFLKPL